LTNFEIPPFKHSTTRLWIELPIKRIPKYFISSRSITGLHVHPTFLLLSLSLSFAVSSVGTATVLLQIVEVPKLISCSNSCIRNSIAKRLPSFCDSSQLFSVYSSFFDYIGYVCIIKIEKVVMIFLGLAITGSESYQLRFQSRTSFLSYVIGTKWPTCNPNA
jgi:hypothetical protein